MPLWTAFDSVELFFLTPEKFGFGYVFLSLIKTLYKCPSASVRTIKHYSEYFDLHRGTQQGCPLSPLLVTVAIEPLAIALRNSRLAVVSKPPTSLLEALIILNNLCQFSGYKLNLNKNELFPINKEALKLNYTDLPQKVVKDHFNYLGNNVTREFKNLFKSNFLTLFDQAKQNQW